MAGFKKLKMTKFLPMLKDRQVRLAAGKNAVPDGPSRKPCPPNASIWW